MARCRAELALIALLAGGCAAPPPPPLPAPAPLLPRGQADEGRGPVEIAGPTPSPAPPASSGRTPMGQAAPFSPPRQARPAVRRAGNLLVVESPPRPPSTFLGRLRTHTTGPLSAGETRVWAGPEVPAELPLTLGSMELFLLDPQPDGGSFAFYREPYNPLTCPLGESRSCAFAAALFAPEGEARWSVQLDAFFSRPDHLEIQDARLSDGVLFFNEACQSYSRESGGRCSSLVAIDPERKALLWRSAPLVSNDHFLPLARYVLTGYGFTSEPRALFLLRRGDGRVAAKLTIAQQHARFKPLGEGRFEVELYGGGSLLIEATGLDGERPRLRLLKTIPPRK